MVIWVFLWLSSKFKFTPIFTMIFVISASKYVSIRSYKEIGGQTYSKLYPRTICIPENYVRFPHASADCNGLREGVRMVFGAWMDLPTGSVLDPHLRSQQIKFRLHPFKP